MDNIRIQVTFAHSGTSRPLDLDVQEGDVIRITNRDDGSLLAEIAGADLLGRDGPCWRCGVHVTASIEAAFIDLEGRSDCGESEDGAPHEIDEPE